jgi:chaperonin cofactor prefoldin
MSKVAELLEQKQTLLERMQEQPGPDQLAEIERGLKEINEALNEIESEGHDDAPIAPY